MEQVLLQAENLVKEFSSGPNRLRVLDQVNLDIRAGDSLAITGASGSGKSTLLSLLAGLDSPTSGRVLLDGKDLEGFGEKDFSRIWGKSVGFIFQTYHLIPTLTAEENVRVPLEIADRPDAAAKAVEWLEKVGLKDRAKHVPLNLSGGEQQRVALARALAPGPSILFADEPTGNLDSKTGEAMADLLFSLVKDQNTTLILVTHEIALAQRAARILELNAGRIVKEIKS